MTGIFVSEKPTDPKEQKQWIESMKRLQVSMWVDGGATCVHCGHTYISVDDFLRCNPKRGFGKGFEFVCSGCWKEYETKQGKGL